MNLTREGKIKLLKEVAARRINLLDLKPKKFLIKIRSKQKGGTQLFINNQEVAEDKFYNQLKVDMKHEQNIRFNVRRVISSQQAVEK